MRWSLTSKRRKHKAGLVIRSSMLYSPVADMLFLKNNMNTCITLTGCACHLIKSGNYASVMGICSVWLYHLDMSIERKCPLSGKKNLCKCLEV